MGVPSLFRWVTRKYRKSIYPVTNQEIDNLYLDLNGIIHPCCHPTNKEAPSTEEEMFREIFKTIDHLVKLTKPRQLLYIAIDGVAPRAKMNQQRERRYKANEKTEGEEEYEEKHCKDKFKFDPNTITPGTPFMYRLHCSLINYIESRQASKEPCWKTLAVIYSGCDVPGEGEHKIYDFVRSIKNNNVRHAICGLDADLIFLSMATHEHSFRVLREDVFWIEREERSECRICKKQGHTTGHCVPPEFPPYIYLDVGVLKGYLKNEFAKAISMGAEFSRMIDDWIFMCFFVGNDFLPLIPSMDIRVNAIETLTSIYVDGLTKRHRYLTDTNSIYVPELINIMKELGKQENTLLRAKFAGYVKTAKKRGEELRSEDISIKLYEESGRLEYYKRKLHAHNKNEITNVCLEYVKGLSWVLEYYHKGCPSWDWYYPFHYAPFADDIAAALMQHSDIKFKFELGEAKKPLEQVMAVLPPTSSSSVPEGLVRVFKDLSENYPETVEVDMFGKSQSWQGVALLPFLDYGKLVALVRKYSKDLPLKDIYLNVEGSPILILPPNNKQYKHAENLYISFLKSPSANLINRFFPGKIQMYSQAHLPGTKQLLKEEKKEYTSNSIAVTYSLFKRREEEHVN
ncbi:hypothetical protein NEOKW01_0220 [Nematocida sp. AWRm80]|nr:hypothetical protein NEOKW01_0220 [Nematocida sp. AWRm80]